MSLPKTMTISCSGGVLVPKAPGLPVPKPQRFFNWPKDLKEGQPPVGLKFKAEVPCDDWHLGLCFDGTCKCDAPEEAVRLVDSVRRDRQLAVEKKIGWDRRPPKVAEPKPDPKPKKQPTEAKDDK